MRAALIGVALAIATSAGSPPVFAQGIVWDRSMEGDSVKVWDYFARDRSAGAEEWVRTVEYNHLAENNFWREYREGHFGEARGDLQYVLRFVPNHPRALYLIAFDPNLTQKPSSIVQYFERALRSFPHAYTYAQYGRYMVSIGRKNVGIVLLDLAIRTDPDLTVARAWREEADTGVAPSTPRHLVGAAPGPATGHDRPSPPPIEP